ncbi:general odorant-binding protein 56d-like [Phlebotomus argentipes]|uniref:general odorant-binding protein 56d-like n=1 Tax=Phlebotomus argentipes TaxID=94469 RepID=UPI002892D9BE|nr:general odorant-binding protein 56d-like [Phlebotomus argentipes]
MKFTTALFVLAFVTIVTAITEEQRKKAREHMQVCSQEIGLPAERVANLRKGDFANADDKTQCFVDCFFKKVGFMDSNGVFQDKVAVEKLSEGESDPSKVKQVVDKCKGESGAGKCETAFKIYQCSYLARAEIL